MKNFILLSIFTIAVFGLTVSAQVSTDSRSSASVDLQSEITVVGKLQTTLNAQKAKVGDEVVVKTTRSIKDNGKTIIDKGSRLIGRVTEVKHKTKEGAGSEIAIIFDRLERGDNVTPVTVSIISIARVVSSPTTVDDTFAIDSSRPSTVGSTTTSSSNRGLLGTATNTASGLENTPRSIAGTVLDTSGRVTGAARDSVQTNIPGLQVDRSANVSANGATSLGMNKGNLKIDSGTVFTVNLIAVSNTN